MGFGPGGLVSIDLQGFAELEEKLKTFGPKVARKMGGRAMRAGANVIIDAAKPHIPVSGKDQPHLEDSVVAVIKRANKDDEVTGAIGFRTPASRHAGFVEFGTAKMPAQPFMRPALDAHAEDAIAVIGETLFQDIEKEAAV